METTHVDINPESNQNLQCKYSSSLERQTLVKVYFYNKIFTSRLHSKRKHYTAQMIIQSVFNNVHL